MDCDYGLQVLPGTSYLIATIMGVLAGTICIRFRAEIGPGVIAVLNVAAILHSAAIVPVVCIVLLMLAVWTVTGRRSLKNCWVIQHLPQHDSQAIWCTCTTNQTDFVCINLLSSILTLSQHDLQVSP